MNKHDLFSSGGPSPFELNRASVIRIPVYFAQAVVVYMTSSFLGCCIYSIASASKYAFETTLFNSTPDISSTSITYFVNSEEIPSV